VTVSTDLAALERRLRILEDREAVRETWLDYCTQIDLGDMDGLGDVFAEDAVLELEGLARSIDGEYRGRRSIIDDFYARTASPSGDPGSTTAMTGHLSTNMRIELDGDEATTLAYFFEIADDNLVLIGTYQHRLRRDADRWRFTFLRIVVRYRARLEVGSVRGRPLTGVVARDVGGAPGIAHRGA
jgi:ketosteroid isomerase-like protein